MSSTLGSSPGVGDVQAKMTCIDSVILSAFCGNAEQHLAMLIDGHSATLSSDEAAKVL